MEETGKRIIEINGVKMEVDLRHAVRVDTMKVGDRVRVLTKSYSGHEVHSGVIVGFEPFKELPTIIVAVAKVSYNSVELTFVYYNDKSEGVEVIPCVDADELDLPKAKIEAYFVDAIAKKNQEIDELERKRIFFLREFRHYWKSEEVELAQ